MATGKEQARAMYEGKALRRQNAEALDKAAQRAATDYLDGTCESVEQAARGRGVPVERVRRAVRARKGGGA